MAESQGFWTIMILAVGLILTFLIRRSQKPAEPEVECPNCGSKEVTEISRDPIDTRTVETASGRRAGRRRHSPPARLSSRPTMHTVPPEIADQNCQNLLEDILLAEHLHSFGYPTNDLNLLSVG